jgi:Zn-dependent protease with chaperone function
MINGLVEWLIIIATSVAVLLFIYAGFLYLTSGGNDSQVKQAKTIFINVAIGFAIMLMAYLIVITIVSLLTGEEWLQKNEGYIPVDLS